MCEQLNAWNTIIWYDNLMNESVTLYASSLPELRKQVANWLLDNQPYIFSNLPNNAYTLYRLIYLYFDKEKESILNYVPNFHESHSESCWVCIKESAKMQYSLQEEFLTFESAIDHFKSRAMIPSKGPDYLEAERKHIAAHESATSLWESQHQVGLKKEEEEQAKYREERRKEEKERIEKSIKQQQEREIQKIKEEEEAKKEKRQQFEYEATARKEFNLLKEKYQVTSFEDDSPLSDLNRILINLDDKHIVDKKDEEWLKSEKLFSVLAIYYMKIGNLAKAGSYWRKANNPQNALDITEHIALPSHYILTMRGGAYRDMNNLEDAKKCALSAIQISPQDYHPYTLLGAIFYQQGLPEEGDKYFEKASALGSKSKEDDWNIESAFKKADSEAKKRVAEFLLSKDQKRYEWAKFYLNSTKSSNLNQQK